ncbi:peptidase M26 [Prevotella buccae]|uniref:peptidase M26 n=1 Tax=Segatella buccae TaxID=28126 RepID=UPI001C602DCD|nr:peptidase M26 [Segatella buccae]MBW4872083.1 peptidase M26 [Segatella buccae]
MKTTNIIQRLGLFFFVLVLAMPAWAQGNEMIIASKADWGKFCDRVNSGQTTLNAKLTQDVDLGSDIVMAGTENPDPFSYDDFLYYTGTFDGQGHTLKFNWNAGKDDRIAPFKYVKDATIKNLRTQGKITKKGYGLSGMVYIALGTTTITGCISDVDITGGSDLGGSHAAGMVEAVADGASVTITDCLVKGSITDNADESYKAMAGFVMSNSGTYTLTRCLYVGKNNATNDKYSKTFGETGGISATFTDCYYLNTCGKAQGDKITEEQLKNGYVAYKLQKGIESQVWGQTLGTDTIPQPTTDAKKRVYEVKFVYNGEVKATRYATNGQSIHGGLPTAQDLLGTGYNPHHYYAIAFADGFNASTTVTADRQVTVSITEKDYYEIASKADWQAFCALVEDGQTAVDAKMTKDVDLETDITMAGTANKPYAGTFDGQNHTLTVNWDAGSAKDVAPFGRVNGATIKNLRTEGSIRSDGYYLGGLIDEAYGGSNTIANCVSAVNITSSYTSDRCGAGGLISFIYTNTQVTITDCLVKGSINASGAGRKGMGGFVYSQNGTCTFNNCLYLGTNNAIAGSNTFTYNATINNCYYLNVCNVAQGDKVTEEELKSGEVTKKLQGDRTENVWGQTLGTDLEPQLTTEKAKHVYKVDFKYMDEVKATRYANSGKTIYGSMPTFTAKDLLGNDYNPKLTYALNFGDFTATTPVTADKSVDVTVTVSGTFPIASKEDWKAFCDLVNGGQNAVDAKLTRNIDLGSEINMVGDDNNKYSGTFDGQNHTLKLDWSNTNGTLAPFKTVDGATIKNLRTEGEIKSSLNFLSGLVYEAYGNTTISGCISAVNITSTYNGSGCDVAGMIECVRDNAKVTITDCVVKGKFHATTEKGRRYMSGFVVNQYGTCTLTNCLYAGENNCSRGYTFCTNSFSGTTITNCYYLNACRVAQGTKVTAEQLKNGEVTKKLQNNRTDKCYWAQQLGEMPDFYNAADKSKANYVYYDAAKKGWACDDFRLTDEQPLPIGLDFTAATVTYERNFNGTQKTTLCLPYDLSAQGFKAYTLSGGNKNEVHFKETKDKLTAYTPYYITADGTPLLGGTNIEVKAYTGANLTTSANGYSIKGTVVSMDNATAAAANAYILQDDGMFHKVTTDNPGATVPAYHAYIICPPQASGAKQLSVVLDGETTGIGSTMNEATDGKNGPVYDLQGRRVADRLDDARHQLPAGVYIVGGRKVVVK